EPHITHRTVSNVHRVNVLARVDVDIHEHQPVLEREGFFHGRIQILDALDLHADMTIGLGQTNKVRQGRHVRLTVAATVLHVLPLTHHAQRLVVDVDDLHRQPVLQTGGQLLNIHLDGAFTSHTRHSGVRECKLHAHGRRQTEAHGAETTGVDPATRLVEL